MKFVPYRICPHIVAYQVDGLGQIAIPDLRCLARQIPAGIHIFVHFPWHSMCDIAERIGLIAGELDAGHPIHLMANTLDEVAAYSRFGLPVLHAPVSLYVFERTFDIQRSTSKMVDAVYVANFRPGYRDEVKRQQLAKHIRSLRIITYPVRHDVAEGNFHTAFYQTFPDLAHAEVNRARLSAHEVATAFNQARTHLALSSAEGCMLSFTEGLLCGVPAVSTRAIGGRDHFFVEPFVKIVDAEPTAIADAVGCIAAARFDPGTIRAAALDVLRSFRSLYASYAQSVCGCPAPAMLSHLFDHPLGPDRLCFHFDRAGPDQVACESQAFSWPRREPPPLRWSASTNSFEPAASGKGKEV